VRERCSGHRRTSRERDSFFADLGEVSSLEHPEVLSETAGGDDGVVSILDHWRSKEDVVADREVPKEGLLVDVGDTLRTGKAADGGVLSAKKEERGQSSGG
jgi:hypothetical protein